LNKTNNSTHSDTTHNLKLPILKTFAPIKSKMKHISIHNEAYEVGPKKKQWSEQIIVKVSHSTLNPSLELSNFPTLWLLSPMTIKPILVPQFQSHPNISKLKLPVWSLPKPLGAFIISFNVTPKDYCYIYFLSSKDYGKTINNSRTFFPRRSIILQLSLVISMTKTIRTINQRKRKNLTFI
jgi:hypothetical protein